MSCIIEDFKTLVSAQLEGAVQRRRMLHQYPELSFEEYKTSAFIKSELERLQIPFVTVAKTGVLGWIDGQHAEDGDVVVLRADIDALPIQELNDVPYKSLHDGVMHACGHDFHTSNLIGVAAILKQLQDSFFGKVLLLFQPAEERIPGGAQEVLKSGVLDPFESRIKAVLGLHVSPQLDVGKVGVRAGRFMASSDEFYINIKGEGGHAAEPHYAIDPIYIGAQLLSSMQQIVSRMANPATPSVLTFGRFIGDGAVNVIPDTVSMEGTFRTMDEKWREQAVSQIERLIRELPVTFGANIDLFIKRGYPFLYNNPDLSQEIQSYFSDFFEDGTLTSIGSWLAAEDFAYYSHRYPSLFYLVGIRNEIKNTQYGLHNARFDVDESAFMTAMQSMVYSTIRMLSKSDQ